MVGVERWRRGLKDNDMLQWLNGATDSQPKVNAVHSPFALLSSSAYVITRIQLHAAFTIFFKASSSHALLPVRYILITNSDGKHNKHEIFKENIN